MFQNGVNRKRDSKSLDACVCIEVLQGTNAWDRSGSNSFRAVSPSLLYSVYFLKSLADPFFHYR